MAAPVSYLTITELSARSGAAPSALRYYEELGLISAERTPGNQRRYPRYVLRRIAFIRAGRQLGLSLREIGAALALLPAGRAPTKAQWSRAAQAWQARIDARVGELQRMSATHGRLHWLRLPVAAHLRPVQPAGHRGRAWRRPPLAPG